jgi:DNA-binding PadR family transcriptional regulator
MPKPKGTCGATKMKILAVIYSHEQYGKESYGYNIWLCLKEHFYTYLNDNDIRNVYHHLNDLCSLGYITKCPESSNEIKQCYRITQSGVILEEKYRPFVDILKNCNLFQ